MDVETTLEPNEQAILLAHRLRQAREAKGWSQPKLGRKIGVHCNTIARYEKEPETITLMNLLKICRALEVTLAELLDENLPQQ